MMDTTIDSIDVCSSDEPVYSEQLTTIGDNFVALKINW